MLLIGYDGFHLLTLWLDQAAINLRSSRIIRIRDWPGRFLCLLNSTLYRCRLHSSKPQLLRCTGIIRRSGCAVGTAEHKRARPGYSRLANRRTPPRRDKLRQCQHRDPAIRRHKTARQISTALVPPNANEFDMTAASSTPVLAAPGT